MRTGVMLSASLNRILVRRKRKLWERLLRWAAFKEMFIVGDAIDLRISMKNLSEVEIPPGNLIVTVRINEQQVYNPTVVVFPAISPQFEVQIPLADDHSYYFLAFRTGMINVKVKFENSLSVPVIATSEFTGEIYTYNESNFLKQEQIHEPLEVYTAALIYSTFALLILTTLLLIFAWFRI